MYPVFKKQSRSSSLGSGFRIISQTSSFTVHAMARFIKYIAMASRQYIIRSSEFIQRHVDRSVPRFEVRSQYLCMLKPFLLHIYSISLQLCSFSQTSSLSFEYSNFTTICLVSLLAVPCSFLQSSPSPSYEFLQWIFLATAFPFFPAVLFSHVLHNFRLFHDTSKSQIVTFFVDLIL